MTKSLGDREVRSSLRRRLQQCREVARSDEGEWSQAGGLSAFLRRSGGSYERLVEDLLPKAVSNDIAGDTLLGVLHEIGEGFRHILYHLKEPKFYRYITFGAAPRPQSTSGT